MRAKTAADAQARKNILAVLLTAKASGALVTVTFDTATFCDAFGFPGVYAVGVQ